MRDRHVGRAAWVPARVGGGPWIMRGTYGVPRAAPGQAERRPGAVLAMMLLAAAVLLLILAGLPLLIRA